MGNFNRERRPSGRRDGGGRGFGRRDSEPKQMFHATCSDCGNSCEVPFKPSGDKPVFCSECFQDKRGGEDRGRSGGKSFDRPSFSRPNFERSGFREKRMYDAVCSECGSDCQLPFEPRNDKPVFCSRCFDKNGKPSGNRDSRGGSNNNDQLSGKFDALNAKLDKILKLLSPDTFAPKMKPESKKEVIKQMMEKKPEEKKEVAKAPKKKVVVAKKVAVKKPAVKKVAKKKK